MGRWQDPNDDVTQNYSLGYTAAFATEKYSFSNIGLNAISEPGARPLQHVQYIYMGILCAKNMFNFSRNPEFRAVHMFSISVVIRLVKFGYSQTVNSAIQLVGYK